MHRRFRTCLLATFFVIVCGATVWRLARFQQKTTQNATRVSETKLSANAATKPPAARPQLDPIRLLSQPGLLNSSVPNSQNSSNSQPSRFAHRLSNTKQSVSQLARKDKAILLENALFDTESALPTIPAELHAEGDPGTYIVQAKGPLTDSFRSLLQQAGATIISYVPNNAYLVRASASAAQSLAAAAQVVLPYEPYYKLNPSLLELVMTQKPLPDDSALNVSLF